mmetsp:Transcript_5456/g.11301  ORF Transcript_5456/g.11301 Transcript_5456/m.11301 type:complete len:217 (+) Transcript_5456:1955-2605(+)
MDESSLVPSMVTASMTERLKLNSTTDLRSPMISLKAVAVSLRTVTGPTATMFAFRVCATPPSSRHDSPKTWPCDMRIKSPFVSPWCTATSPDLMKNMASALSPMLTIYSLSLNLRVSITLARALRCSSLRGERSGTALRKLAAETSDSDWPWTMTRRNFFRSSAHSLPASTHLTVAARGELYRSASSPKQSPDEYVVTASFAFCCSVTSYLPDSTR